MLNPKKMSLPPNDSEKIRKRMAGRIRDYIEDVRDNGDKIFSFVFTWDNRSAVSLLAIALKAFIRTYAQYAVTLTSAHTETSDYYILSGLLGLVVDNRSMIIPQDQTRGNIIRGYFSVTGEILFTTYDIPSIPWFKPGEIYALPAGETVSGYVDVACDDASFHPKHITVVNVQTERQENGTFHFVCEKVGNLTTDQIMDQINYAYRMAMSDPNKTIYTRIDIPDFPEPGFLSEESS